MTQPTYRRKFVLIVSLFGCMGAAVRAGDISALDYSLDAASPTAAEYKYNSGSLGKDYIDQMLAGQLEMLYFSVDRLTTGAPGSTVASRFSSTPSAMYTSAIDVFGFDLQSMSPNVNIAVDGTGSDLGLTGGFFGDDLDALGVREYRPGRTGPITVRENLKFPYNSRWRDSVDIGKPAKYLGTNVLDPDGISPDDIFIGAKGGLFASGVADLGLQPGDGIDGLIVMDVTPDPLEPLGYRLDPNHELDPGFDMVVFSLDAYSPSTLFGNGTWSPADVLLSDFLAPAEVLIPYADLGLNATDNVDALSIIPEPAAGVLLIVGGLLMGGFRSRQRRRATAASANRRAAILPGLWVLMIAGAAHAQLFNPVPGDSDNDQDIDLRDFARFQIQTGAPGTFDPRIFDIDVDSDTDLNDYELFRGALAGPVNACSNGIFVNMCGTSPPINGSKALMNLRYDEGSGQVCLDLDASHPAGLSLPLQQAQTASIIGGSTPRIVFTHIVNYAGGQLRIHGDIILGQVGRAVVDLKPLDNSQAVRFLLRDMSLVGVVHGPPSPTDIAGCTGETKQFAFSFTPLDPNEPIYGTWQIVDESGAPVDTSGLAASTGFYAFDPAEGSFNFANPSDQVAETVTVFARQFHLPSEPKSYRIKVTASTVNLDCPIPPSLSNPITFRTLSVSCAFGNQFFELVPPPNPPDEPETRETKNVPLVITNPCNVRLTGTYSVDSNAFYSAPTAAFNVAPGAVATVQVPLKNDASHGPPQPVSVTVVPDQAGQGQATGFMTFQPPIVRIVESRYTKKVNTGGDDEKSAVYLKPVSLNEQFTATIDWRGHGPGTVEFKTDSATNPVGTMTNTASFTFQMSSFPVKKIGEALAVAAAASDGSRSVVDLPGNFGIVLNPVRDNTLIGSHDGTSVKELKYGYNPKLKFNPLNPLNIPGDKFDEKAAGQGGNKWEWSPSIELLVGVSGSARTAASGISLGLTGGVDTGKTVISANKFGKTKVPKTMGIEIEGKASYEFLWTVPLDATDWKENGGRFGASAAIALAVPPSPAQFTVVVFVIPIPCYWQGKVSFGIAAQLTMLKMSDPGQPENSGEVVLEPGAEFILGVGVASIKVGIEAVIGGKVRIGMVFPNPEPPAGSIGPVNKFELLFTGELRANLFIYTFSLASTSCNFILLPNPGLDCPLLPSSRGDGWEISARDYTLRSDFAEFLANSGPRGGGPTTEITIVNNEFPNADPDISASGGNPLLVWLTDDVARPTLDRTKVLFSRNLAGTWSSPVAIEDDGTADFDPQIAGIGGGDAVAVWVDANQSIPPATDVTDYPQYLEISAAVYDGGADTWSAPVSLSTNSHLDFTPRVASAGDGTALAVWTSNSADSIYGSAAEPNSIMYSIYNGTSWSAAQTAATNLGSILDINVAYDGTEAVLMFTSDPDDDLATPDDLEIFALTYNGASWSSVQQITNDGLRDVNPHPAYDENGDLLFIWYRDGDLVSATQFNLSDLSTIIDRPSVKGGIVDFDLAVDTSGVIGLVWPEESDELSDVFYAVYDADHNAWSGTRRMLSDRDNERDLSATFGGDGKVYLAYRKVEFVTQQETINVDGEDVILDFPAPDHADVVVAEHTVFTDLAVLTEDFTLDPGQPGPGDIATIGIVVHNLGDLAASNIDVAVYDGDPNGGGVQIGATQTIAGPFMGGDSTTLGFLWTVPATSTMREIFAVVDPAQVQDDFDFGNNTASAFALTPDLEIDQIVVSNPDLCSREIFYRVTNHGPTDAPASEITVRAGASDGLMLSTIGVPALAAGAVDSNSFLVPVPSLTSNGQALIYAVLDEADAIPEFDDLNNVRVALVDLLATGTADCNTNGISDACDIQLALSEDCNTNGVPDECEADCNTNGAPDDCDIAFGPSSDANTNALPDECEDCNANSVVDSFDVSGGTSGDCNGNTVPDECEPDCNSNSVADECDIAAVTSIDCDANQVPDECEDDCNTNGRTDACDINLFLTSLDCDSNGVPDECQPDCDSTGIADGCEIAAGSSGDCDGDAVPDGCEPDTDGDTVVDDCDNCPADANPGQEDLDADGLGDVCDIDADADGAQGPLGDNSDCDDLEPQASPLIYESYPLGNCADGIDNDCDGFADAADPNC